LPSRQINTISTSLFYRTSPEDAIIIQQTIRATKAPACNLEITLELMSLGGSGLDRDTDGILDSVSTSRRFGEAVFDTTALSHILLRTPVDQPSIAPMLTNLIRRSETFDGGRLNLFWADFFRRCAAIPRSAAPVTRTGSAIPFADFDLFLQRFFVAPLRWTSLPSNRSGTAMRSSRPHCASSCWASSA
jgi:hypothetical protein